MKTRPTLLSIRDCNLQFAIPFKREPLQVLDDVTLEVYEGEFLVLLGPSGSGKSTLLRVMSGLEIGCSGSITMAPHITKNDISFVFQQFALFPWLTVFENIAIGLYARQEKVIVVEQKVKALAEELGLKDFLHSYPQELSGGMKQRVGIARALVTDPKIIFMDEPFSGLDSFTAALLRKELLRIWQGKNVTIVLVTHLVAEAIELADRVAVVSPRPASIEVIIQNELPRPRQLRGKKFFDLEDEILAFVKP